MFVFVVDDGEEIVGFDAQVAEFFGEIVFEIGIVEGADFVADAEFFAVTELVFEDVFDEVVEGGTAWVYDEGGLHDAADTAVWVWGLQAVAVDDAGTGALEEDHLCFVEIFSHHFEGLQYAKARCHGVGSCYCGDDISGHLLDIEFGSWLNTKYE